MPKIFEEADQDVRDVLNTAIDRWHKPLRDAGVTFNLLTVRNVNKDGESLGGALKHHGYAALAVVKINSHENRAKGLADATILIDAERWQEQSDHERLALLDHECAHLEVSYKDTAGGGTQVKLDDLGRPKLKIRLHDYHIGGFSEVGDRHKGVALEVQALAAAGTLGVRQGWFSGF